MKIILSLLLLPIFCNAQLIKTNGKKWNTKAQLEKINDSTAFFIDTIKVNKSDLGKVKPEEIALITAYFEDEPDLPEMFRSYLQNGAISFITKPYAIAKYRNEFSKISDEYKELTKQYSTDRDSLLYIVDGDTLKPNVEGALININLSRIETIQVIFPDEAQKRFGDIGRFGVVFINPRKE